LLILVACQEPSATEHSSPIYILVYLYIGIYTYDIFSDMIGISINRYPGMRIQSLLGSVTTILPKAYFASDLQNTAMKPSASKPAAG
jgi:hypothetical protein